MGAWADVIADPVILEPKINTSEYIEKLVRANYIERPRGYKCSAVCPCQKHKGRFRCFSKVTDGILFESIHLDVTRKTLSRITFSLVKPAMKAFNRELRLSDSVTLDFVLESKRNFLRRISFYSKGHSYFRVDLFNENRSDLVLYLSFLKEYADAVGERARNKAGGSEPGPRKMSEKRKKFHARYQTLKLALIRLRPGYKNRGQSEEMDLVRDLIAAHSISSEDLSFFAENRFRIADRRLRRYARAHPITDRK